MAQLNESKVQKHLDKLEINKCTDSLSSRLLKELEQQILDFLNDVYNNGKRKSIYKKEHKSKALILTTGTGRKIIEIT